MNEITFHGQPVERDEYDDGRIRVDLYQPMRSLPAAEELADVLNITLMWYEDSKQVWVTGLTAAHVQTFLDIASFPIGTTVQHDDEQIHMDVNGQLWLIGHKLSFADTDQIINLDPRKVARWALDSEQVDIEFEYDQIRNGYFMNARFISRSEYRAFTNEAGFEFSFATVEDAVLWLRRSKRIE